jgi:hypothetical protein
MLMLAELRMVESERCVNFPQLPVQGTVRGTKNVPDVSDVNMQNIVQNKRSFTLRHVVDP